MQSPLRSMPTVILDSQTGKNYQSMQEYWKGKYLDTRADLWYIEDKKKKIKELQKIQAENKKLLQAKKQLQCVVNFLTAKRSEQESELNKFGPFIDKFANLLIKREPSIYEHLNKNISLGKMESALQKIIAELMFYEAFAIKATVDNTKAKTAKEQNACNYINDHIVDSRISDRHRYLNYQNEQKKICEVAQKYKDKVMSQSLFKHSEIFKDLFQNYFRLSAQVEEAKKMINQIKDNIDKKKPYITYLHCSLYQLFQNLMQKIATLYPSTSSTHAYKNTSNTLPYSQSTLDDVRYDRIMSFVDKLYQNIVNQPQGYQSRVLRLSEKMRSIEDKISTEQSYEKERRQQLEAYRTKINEMVLHMLFYLGKQAAPISRALHVFTFELADVDSIMSQIKNRQQKKTGSLELKQIESIKQYLKECNQSCLVYFEFDSSLLQLQSISSAVRCYCEALKSSIKQLNNALEQRKRSALLNEAKKLPKTANDEIQQMSMQIQKENQLLLANNKKLQAKLNQAVKQHTNQIQNKDQQIEQLHSQIRSLENDVATAKQQTLVEVQVLKKTTEQKQRELNEEIQSLTKELSSVRTTFGQTLKIQIAKKEEEIISRQSLLRNQIESLNLRIADIQLHSKQTATKLNQSHAMQIQHLQKEHKISIESKNCQLSDVGRELQQLKHTLQQNQLKYSQLTREKYQLELANERLSAELQCIKTQKQLFIKSKQEENQKALSSMAAEYATRLQQLCNNQNNDQLKTISQAYQKESQSLKKMLKERQQLMESIVQERNSLQLASYQLQLKVEQLKDRQKNEQYQRTKLSEETSLEMEKLKADKNTAWQQLQQQERELAEIRVQLQQQQNQKQLLSNNNLQLCANEHRIVVEFQARIKEIQQDCNHKLESNSEQMQKYQQQIHQYTLINSQLRQKHQAQMRQSNLQFEELSQANKYYCEQITYKQQQIHTITQQLAQFKESCQQLETENIVRLTLITELSGNIETQEQQKKQQQEQIARLKRQHAQQHTQLTQQLTLLNHQLTQLNLLLKIQQQKHILTTEREARTNQQLKQLQNQYQALARQNQNITQKYIEETEKYQQLLNQQIGTNMIEVSKISEAVGNSFIENPDDEKIKQLQNLLKQKQQQFQNNFAKHRKQSEQEISTLKQKNKQLENRNKSLQQKNELIEAETQSTAAQIGALQEEIKSRRETEKYNRDTQQQLKAELNNAKIIIQSQKQKMQSLNKTIESHKQEIDKLKQEKIKNQNPYKSAPLPILEDTLMVPYTRPLFNQDIFADDEIHKTVLVKHIENYIHSRIVRTRLLHKYDTRNKTNFHQFIDEVPTLCLVIKTKYAIISGFYPGTLRDKEILDKGGLLVSVTNNSSYNLYTKKKGDTSKVVYKAMIYDTFFAIFGNAEIRVKTGFKTVFSNFGVSNGYFNNQGDKISKFLNEGETREVQFEYCQFYQVLFEENINPATFITSA